MLLSGCVPRSWSSLCLHRSSVPERRGAYPVLPTLPLQAPLLPSANNRLPPASPVPNCRPAHPRAKSPIASVPLLPAAFGQGSPCHMERGCSYMLKQCKHFPSPNAVSRGNNYRFPRFNREYF